ncbi:hypothetical protein NQ317_018185 [Molorchus minor]|uniref:Uncharacterized protein n=1 Tax=Molorchus minor TaxID=1323400 RepID=A0ABQ9JWR3_9CUCU|nr:hypothetical protein NQ317_018185 [Molorchus minor]
MIAVNNKINKWMKCYTAGPRIESVRSRSSDERISKSLDKALLHFLGNPISDREPSSAMETTANVVGLAGPNQTYTIEKPLTAPKDVGRGVRFIFIVSPFHRKIAGREALDLFSSSLPSIEKSPVEKIILVFYTFSSKYTFHFCNIAAKNHYLEDRSTRAS